MTDHIDDRKVLLHILMSRLGGKTVVTGEDAEEARRQLADNEIVLVIWPQSRLDTFDAFHCEMRQRPYTAFMVERALGQDVAEEAR